jgi:hypothetical protein
MGQLLYKDPLLVSPVTSLSIAKDFSTLYESIRTREEGCKVDVSRRVASEHNCQASRVLHTRAPRPI